MGDFDAFQGDKHSPVPWILSRFLPVRPSLCSWPSYHLSEPIKGGCLWPLPTSSPCFSSCGSLLRDWWKGKRKRWMLSHSFSFSLPFLSFNWKTQGAPPIPRQRQKKILIFVVYLSTLVCWINHFTPVINKRTNGWMSLPSDYWFTNRQDVYFLRENYMEHFNFVDFLFVLFCWFLPLSPLPGFFARRGGFLWDCTDPHPTQHHRHHTQVQ